MLDQWFLSDMGVEVTEAFLAELVHTKALLHGDTLLQLGCSLSGAFFATLPFARKWIAAPYAGSNVDLVTLLNHLPLERHSLDCVIAPLTLEAFYKKEDLIDEIDRVLKPMGHIVFFGVNPFSLWGLWLLYSRNTCLGTVRLKPKSVLSVKFLMLHRGYVQNYLSSFYYIPPVTSKENIEKYRILNQVGKMISPLPSAFYCLIVQKPQEICGSGIILPTQKKYVPSSAPPLQPTCRSQDKCHDQ